MNWHRSLYARLAIGLIVILLSVGVVYTLSVSWLTHRWQQTATQTLNRDLARNLVADKRIVHDGRIDTAAMKKTFMEYMSINPSIEIYYLDRDGKILSFSAEPGKVKRERVDLGPVREFLSGKAMLPLLGDDPRAHDRRKTFSVTPLPNAEHPEGYLYVVLQGEDHARAQQARTLEFLLSVATPGLVGSLLIGLVIGLLLFHLVTRRLRRLSSAVTAFADNGFRQATPLPFETTKTRPRDEIDELETRFAEMSRHIASQWSALAQQDRLRREMIASISHDLRTPLASALGYLETIELKSDQLDEDEKARYLEIAIRQTRRLQTLIDQLFELVKLEAHDMRLQFEKFSILELAYDVVGKFALEAQRQGIALKVAETALDATVVADIGLIERVLDNLIANALDHTPAGCAITIDVRENTDGQAIVSVSDEGKGIAPEEQSLIFEQFHRADNPQRSSTGHAGLGLAIVRKIVELHQQKIEVDSEPGKGATFRFTLHSA